MTTLMVPAVNGLPRMLEGWRLPEVPRQRNGDASSMRMPGVLVVVRKDDDLAPSIALFVASVPVKSCKVVFLYGCM
jgi:hypothetical protein